jgi:hypothetical protein
MIAGMAVTAADPSGLWGLLKESFAGGSALTQAITSANANALVKDKSAMSALPAKADVSG